MAFLVRAATVLLVSSLLSPQNPDFTVRVEVPLVTVDVSVTDRNGQPVAGLDATDFEVLDDGIPQNLRYFGSSAAPYHAYLLLDISASTQDGRAFMQEFAAEFLHSIRSQDQIAMGVFGEDVETILNWTVWPAASADPLTLRPAQLNQLNWGTSEFYRSLDRVLDEAFDGIAERRAIIVLTDGRDTSLYRMIQQEGVLRSLEDDERFQSIHRKAATAGIPVHLVALDTDLNPGINNGGNEYRSLRIMYPESRLPDLYLAAARERMEDIARTSGGTISFPGNMPEALSLLEQATRSLGEAYSLGWSPPAEVGSGARTIEVRIPGHQYTIHTSRSEYGR